MTEIMKKISFNDEECAFFEKLWDSLSPDVKAQLDALRERYYMRCGNTDAGDTNKAVAGELISLSESTGVNPDSMNMLFLLRCGMELPEVYRKAGLDEALAYNMLRDLRCKLTECENNHGVMGTFVFNWFHRHFLLTRFALGRFQYDPSVWNLDTPYSFGGVTLNKGDKVYNFHIPSAGPMPREMRLDSYRQAHDFFGYKPGEPIPITCSSWLLYDGNREVYPAGSNLMDFMDDFDLIASKEPEAVFSNAWRVFNRDFDGDTSVLPRDTTLQRNYIKYLESGKKVGHGTGVILFDGEKIINNKRDH